MISLEIKDLGVVHNFLVLRVKVDGEEGYVMDQEVIIVLCCRSMDWTVLMEFGPLSATTAMDLTLKTQRYCHQ